MKYEIPQIIKLLGSRLNEHRFYHSVCVAEWAREIAEIYGYDPDKAYLAGLVHDIMRNETEDDMRRYIENSGIVLTPLEMSSIPLWHAILGADYIRKELGITDPEIINAVRYHTTGRRNMSLPEKIIFLADCSSADRDYGNVEDIRDYIRNDMNRAMFEVLDFTVKDLNKKGLPAHPDTLEAYSEFIR